MKQGSYQAYSHASHTVAKTRQVVMLYDGAVRFLSQAREAMQQNAIEKRYQLLTRANDIINGLQACLDFDAGSQAAQTLYDFYSNIDRRIMQLHRSNDAEACSTVIQELKEMREVWAAIDRGPAEQRPAEPAAPAAPIASPISA